MDGKAAILEKLSWYRRREVCHFVSAAVCISDAPSRVADGEEFDADGGGESTQGVRCV